MSEDAAATWALDAAVAICESLHTGTLDEQWVSEAWEGSLCDLPTFPHEINNGRVLDAAMAFLDTVSFWSSKEADATVFWLTLVEKNLLVRSLLAALAAHVNSSETDVECKLALGAVYFQLMTVPGAVSHKVFNTIVFRAFVRAAINTAEAVAQNGRTTGAEPTEWLCAATCSLTAAIGVLGASYVKDTMDVIVEAFHTATHCVPSKDASYDAALISGEVDYVNMSSSRHPLVLLGYQGLYKLIARGGDTDAARMVFKTLLKTLSMSWAASTSSTFTQGHQLLHAFAVHFVETLKAKKLPGTQKYFRILAQHLCTSVPDKAAHRHAGATAFAAIVSCMDGDEAASLLSWLITFSRSAKVTQRLIAIEYITHVLKTETLWQSHLELDGDGEDDNNASVADAGMDVAADEGSNPQAPASSSSDGDSDAENDPLNASFTASPEKTATPLKSKTPSSSTTNRTGRAWSTHTQNMLIEQLYGILASRVTDRAIGVRARAMKCLAVLAAHARETGLLRGTLAALYTNYSATSVLGMTPSLSFTEALDPSSPKTPVQQRYNQPQKTGLFATLQERLHDRKGPARKAALGLLETLLLLQPTVSKQEMNALCSRGRDLAVSVRRQALFSSFNVLLAHPHNTDLQRIFFENMTPLLLDGEEFVRTKALEMMFSLFFADRGDLPETVPLSDLSTAMLSLLADRQEYTRYVQHACKDWVEKKMLKKTHISALFSSIDQGKTNAWVLLGLLAPFAHSFIKPDQVYALWQHRVFDDMGVSCVILDILSSLSDKLSAQQTQQLQEELRAQLKVFAFPPPLIAIAMTTLSKLDAAQASTKEGLASTTVAFCKDLVARANAPLAACTQSQSQQISLSQQSQSQSQSGTEDGEANSQQQSGPMASVLAEVSTISTASSCASAITSIGDLGLTEDHLERCIFTIGEAAMCSSTSVTTRGILTLEGIIAQGVMMPENDVDGSNADESQEAGSASRTRKFGLALGGAIRAQAYLALGKICLQREELAKEWIASMARELECCPDPIVRNNIVVILSDLCVRYSAFTENYIPKLALSLQDESPVVRRQALLLITRLLTEDFIKLKGYTFFRLLVALIDEDLQVRQLAYYCVVNMLFVKFPTIFRVHFLETVFHLNDYRKHPLYNRLEQSDSERRKFSLLGEANKGKREYIYRIMLENCNDLDKLNLTQDLCLTVLGGVSDGELALDNDIEFVLKDTLAILASKHIKLGRTTKGDDDLVTADDDASSSGINGGTAAKDPKSQLISKIAKKALVQNILPVVIQLKKFLEKKRSPFQHNIMVYLREVLQDHKHDVEEMLAADQQLAREIKFDIAQFEKEARNRRLSVASLAATPSVDGQQHKGQRRFSSNSPATPTATTARGMSAALTKTRSFSGNGIQAFQQAISVTSPFVVGSVTPGFRAPKLRVQSAARQKEGTSVVARHTPLRHAHSAATPMSRSYSSLARASSTPSSHGSLSASASHPEADTLSTSYRTAIADDDERDIITLETPTASRQRPKKWKVAPPVFDRRSSSSEKRSASTADEADASDAAVTTALDDRKSHGEQMEEASDETDEEDQAPKQQQKLRVLKKRKSSQRS